jgi:pantetheine-phosphate adenylyltransferase
MVQASSVAIYPGSFDPVTRGHEDIALRASQLFPKVIVAVTSNVQKQALFSLEERMALLEQSLGTISNIEIAAYEGLTVQYARHRGASVILRGLRALSDFEYECSMSQMNRTLDSEVQTVFLMAGLDYQFLSSRMAREVALLGGSVDKLVAPHVKAALLRKNASGQG